MAKRILAVEDEPDILECLEIILSTSGYFVDTSLTSLGIEQKITDFKPDLIILDIMLGACDGREICKAIKSNSKLKHIPIIMLSAHPDVVNSVSAYGANDFIAKPFDLNDLLYRVKINIAPEDIAPGIAC